MLEPSELFAAATAPDAVAGDIVIGRITPPDGEEVDAEEDMAPAA